MRRWIRVIAVRRGLVILLLLDISSFFLDCKLLVRLGGDGDVVLCQEINKAVTKIRFV